MVGELPPKGSGSHTGAPPAGRGRSPFAPPPATNPIAPEAAAASRVTAPAVTPAASAAGAGVAAQRLEHPPPPEALYGPNGRLLPLQLSAAAIEAAWANAPPPMPDFPRWDPGPGGYIGTLLQWCREGRIGLRPSSSSQPAQGSASATATPMDE